MKKMAYKNDDPCLKKAFDDEPLFILMARDESAPMVILYWIKVNLKKQPKEKLQEAYKTALEMLDKHEEIYIKVHGPLKAIAKAIGMT